jgi:hypothetical protein
MLCCLDFRLWIQSLDEKAKNIPERINIASETHHLSSTWRRKARDAWQHLAKYALGIHDCVDDAIEESDKLKPCRLATNSFPHDKCDPRVVINLKKAGFFSFKNQNPVDPSTRLAAVISPGCRKSK